MPLSNRLVSALVLVCVVLAGPASAQVKSRLVASGFSAPIAFVQDPSDPTVQMVVQQNGRIRVLKNGAVQATDFLNLSSVVVNAGEMGMLGLAFAPDYATSRRFYVNFIIHPNGDVNLQATVVARFLRSTSNPLVADAASRFDFLWPEGHRYISQPYTNHKGGNMAFGPDGYLYVGLGDGGSGGDPQHRAQDPTTVLGKMLRLNVNVADADAEGYDIPSTNPYVGQQGVLPEIWDFGLRNPWRWSFDDPAHGGTGALVIGDVGQGAWEEINYEPANRGGRNYGWRLREGRHNYDTSRPAFSTPLTEPIHDYGHGVGHSVTGGFVYRGQALGPGFTGRYFFADVIDNKVWSLGLALDGNGEATATNLLDHSFEIGAAAAMVSSFGVDAAGELYLVSYSAGKIYVLEGNSQPVMFMDTPVNGNVATPFAVSGWAIDLGSTSGPGIDTVHVWAVPHGQGTASFIGASSGNPRPDVAGAYGSQFLNSGFGVVVNTLPAGAYSIVAYGHSAVTGNFEIADSREVVVVGQPLMNIDVPGANSAWAGRFPMSGWALDLAASAGTGVAAVQVWAQRVGEAARFVGLATLGGARPDVGAAFGSQFTNSGWSMVAGGLPPGSWTATAYLQSATTGSLVASKSVDVTLTDGMRLQIDGPANNAVLSAGTHHVVGWALDLASVTGSGVGAIHVWAVPTNGSPATFLGVATLGVARPDVGAAFGSQFNQAGYDRAFSLPAGQYDIVVYSFRDSTGSFDLAKVVRVTIGS